MYRRHYGNVFCNDPRWLSVKYSCKCERCGAAISRGDQAYYYPLTKTMLCSKDECGGQGSRDFNAAACDEAFYNGNF